MQNISTLVFDLDGTISDPSLGISRSLNYALSTYGFPEVPAMEISAEIGRPLDETFRKFSPDSDPTVIAKLIAAYRERYAEIGYSENQIYPGISESLQILSDNGIRMGVCTSKRKDFAEKILDLFGVRSYFQFVNGGDIGIHKRDQLGELLRELEIDPLAVMIGDRDVDISSAKANRLRSIGVLWGFGSLAELRGVGADLILFSTTELTQLNTSNARIRAASEQI